MISIVRSILCLADLSAGLVVFLVAVPLCLGIALASNAPPLSGILSGIIGGILVGIVSKSHTSVSGPAAGLTAVVAAQIASLGSFETFLLAVTIAGALQILLGVAASRCDRGLRAVERDQRAFGGHRASF